MDVHVPFEVGQEVWAVVRVTSYRPDLIACSNCQASGEVRVSPTIRMKCKRCDGEGRIKFGSGHEWQVHKSTIACIEVRIGNWGQWREGIEYCFYAYRNDFSTSRVFADESTAKDAADKLNVPELAEFERRKSKAMKPIDLLYDDDDE